MTLPGRRALAHGLLATSLLLNASMIAYLANSGGLRRMAVKLHLARPSSTRALFMEADEARFRKLPAAPDGVFFAGDSLVASGPWAEFYSPIHVRGIGGEKSSGLLKRIDEVVEDRPRKLFLLIGANDLASAVPPADYLANYREILARVRSGSPETAIYAIGVLPVNDDFADPPTYTNAEVREVNRQLRELVEGTPGARFVDLADLLADGEGRLRPNFTNDGLHLTVEGYLAIRDRIRGLVEGEPAAPPRETPKP